MRANLTYLCHSTAMHVAHNAKRGNNLVFCVETTTGAQSCEHQVACWLTTAVNKLYPVATGSYPHSLVIGTWDDNSVEIDSDGKPTGEVLNRLLAVIHVDETDRAVDLIEGLIIPAEQQPSMVLDAAAVVSALKSVPLTLVGGVGVSAVSDVVAAELWGEIISVDRSTMDGSGKGYMQHPAYYYDDRNGVSTGREKSYNFGWDTHAAHVRQGNLANRLAQR